MLFSMTGFGRGTSARDSQRAHVQLRSVNHRSLDVRCMLPPGFGSLEVDIMRRVRRFFSRGRIQVRVEVDGLQTHRPTVDRVAAEDFYRRLDQLRVALNIDTEVPLSDVLQAPGVLATQEGEADDAARELVSEALESACAALVESRQREGAELHSDLIGHLDVISEALEAATARAPKRLDEARSRLESRIEALSDTVGEIDPQRLAIEVALIAEKTDIGEELARARAHVDELDRLLNDERDATDRVGKQLDFFLQELNREVNTMGSKSRDTELTRLTIDMKSALEAMREQAANVQ